MALTDEQRAMLQLLLEGGQGYDDIGSLLGIGPDEVRSRARAALGEMGGADPDAQVGLSDYLLGQADPIGRADAVRHLQGDPDANALADRLAQQLRLIAPKASLPEIPPPRGGRRAAPPPPSAVETHSTPAAPPPPPAARRPGIASRVAGALSRLGSGFGGASGRRRTQITVAAAGGLALVIVAIVLATGSGDDGVDCTPIGTSQAEQAGSPTIALDPVGAAAEADCEPSGKVSLIPVGQQGGQNQRETTGFGIEMNAVNLEPTADGNAYVLWLVRSEDQARALGQQPVNENGDLTGAAPLLPTDLALMEGGTLRVSRVTEQETQQIEQALQSQGKRPTGLVAFAGTTVLEGDSTALLQQLQQLLQAAAQARQQQQAGEGGGGQSSPPQGGPGSAGQ